MARATQRGGMTWVHGFLITFVILWLVSTVGVVWLYVDREELVDRAVRATKAANRVMSEAEKSSLPWYNLAGDTGPTAVGLAEQARANLAQLAAGSAEDDVGAIRAKSKQLVRRIVDDQLVPSPAAFEGADLVTVGQILYDLYLNERSLREAAESAVATLAEEIEQLAALNEEQLAAFDERINQLQSDYQDLLASAESYRGDRDEEVAQLGQRIDELRQESARQSQAFRAERSELQQRNEELHTRYRELRGKLGQIQISPQTLVTARQADARIMSANPGEDVVYIDLGKEDRVVLGMRFGVYSKETGIPASGQAKAQIEVITTYARSSACRVLRRSAQSWIIEGDLVANPLYDPDKPLRFLVSGEFDSNGDGRPDPNGEDQIKALIENWGGELVNELTPLVDFIVLGAPPSIPYTGQNLDPEEEARNQPARARRDAYEALVKDAQSLSVPILTPSVLSRFLGYNDSPDAYANR